MSNTEVPPESAEYTLVATETRDDSSFSQVVKDLCSKDHCGRPVQPVYYTTELAIDNGEGDVNATASDDPVFLLVEDRVAISGIDEDSARAYRRQNRRHHRRQMRRQHADQNGASNWRQRRRHHRRQRGN
ncbi:hypothetical protein BaRGS_00033536 [Batillaria attramentaria]|uniref:Halobacterial output domain-containing protein n=1 Tax=Batillaria attramentaria TaxID=370345 RepID=A0ABD0JJX1_9CAEN